MPVLKQKCVLQNIYIHIRLFIGGKKMKIKQIQLFDDIDTDEIELIQNTINECDNGDCIHLELCNSGGS